MTSPLQRLQQQLRLFEAISSTTPDFLYIFDLQGRFLYANRRLLEVWGVSYEQAIGRNLYELGYPKWHADMHMRELDQVIRTKQPIKGDVPFTGGSGISGVYEYIFTPVLGDNGEVEIIAGTTRDVSEHKQAEIARRELAERYAAQSRLFHRVLSSITDFAYTFDLEGRFTFVNKPLLDLWGLTLDQAIGKNFFDLKYEPQLAAKLQRQIQEVILTRQRIVDETPYTNPAGETGYYQYIFCPVLAADGSVEAVAGSTRDYTQLRQMQQERERILESERAARAEAERASRMKDEFLATLSHELRTPLNAIMGWAQILHGNPGSVDDVREGVEIIERNARAQTQIIEDLLDMSRIISGKIRLNIQRLDLATIVQTAVETVRPAAQAKGVMLEVVLHPQGCQISGDSNRLQQVFWNLLTNAVKFTPRGGQVQVLVERNGPQVEVSVIDTGEGIDRQFLPYVFDRFRQADASTTRRHGGLGLGLALVRQLAELHGGRVHVRSGGAGFGSVFTVVLPLSISLSSTDESAPLNLRHDRPVLLADESCARIGGVRVLVVDDEPDARALVKRLLEDCKAVVSTAGSVAEALQLFETARPDVLVSDIGMPGEDGYSLVRKMRALDADSGRDIPAVALTAYARAEDRAKAVAAGFQHHLVKPVDPAQLIRTVAALAGKMTDSVSASV